MAAGDNWPGVYSYPVTTLATSNTLTFTGPYTTGYIIPAVTAPALPAPRTALQRLDDQIEHVCAKARAAA